MLKHEHGDDEQLRHYARLIGSRCAPRLLAELARSPAAPPSLRALATLFDPAVTNVHDGTTPLPRGSKRDILGAIYCSARSLAVTTGAIAPDAAPDASGAAAGMGGMMMRGAADMQLDPAAEPLPETAAADEDEAEEEEEDEEDEGGGDDEPSSPAEAVDDDGASASVPSMAAYALRIGRLREAQRARQQWSKLRSVSMFRSFGKKGGGLGGGGLGSGGGLGAAVADAAAAADAAASPAAAAPSPTPTPPPPPPPPGDVMGGVMQQGGSCRDDDDKVWRRGRVRTRRRPRVCVAAPQAG